MPDAQTRPTPRQGMAWIGLVTFTALFLVLLALDASGVEDAPMGDVTGLLGLVGLTGALLVVSLGRAPPAAPDRS